MSPGPSFFTQDSLVEVGVGGGVGVDEVCIGFPKDFAGDKLFVSA